MNLATQLKCERNLLLTRDIEGVPVEASHVAIILVPDDGLAQAGSSSVLHIPEEPLTPEVPHEGPHHQT